MAVQQSVRYKDFAYEEALEAYQVTNAQYKSFIGETTIKNIFLSFSGTTAPVRKSDFLEIYENMLLSYFPRPPQRLKFIVKELEKEAKETI
jgi:formylglycine-generating enzyme required for sulfatase activity